MTVLVLSAHPDDAEIAMGGTIAALSAQGVEVVVTCFTVSDQGEARKRRRRAAEDASAILGHRIEWINDGIHDQVEEIRDFDLVTLVDREVERWDPATVVTHWEGDSHADHVRLARAVIASLRRSPERSFLQFGPNDFRTVAFPMFAPQVYSRIGSVHLKLKLQALECYQTAALGVRDLQMEAISLITRARGIEVGAELAESFRLARQTVDLRGADAIRRPNPFA